METWRHVSECLDSGLMGALKIEERSASVGTGKADAAQHGNFMEASGADCPENDGPKAGLSPSLTPCDASAPETTPARRQAGGLLRLKLVVSNGRTVMRAAALRTCPRPAVRLFLATINGVRVSYAAPPST